ncbi:MinD/ParA/CobQ/CobA-like protein [Rubripirellula tenax]|uniref:MinD/ParA/CobQ/CobA-like protein n=1 Tax=Rubripirellula tenax TaxID=2528015 RepID=A0A5C6F107_9BACT|nr:ParA family protein [Rubripirellula tenax]TWU54715.1 MinD/ParA/CobQ/CobA-like protein [Rubripirellula tenax]
MAGVTLCLINQKGGCGKSSTCFHLAGAFAGLGYSVLAVDADPQGSLSQGFFGSDEIENLPAEQTLAAVFDESTFFVDRRQLIRQTSFDNIAILPTNLHLATFNAPTPESAGMIQYSLRDALDEIGEYDVTLIDCPPNLYQCSWNAMIAADYVVIPVPPEDFGTQGLRAVHQCIDNARKLNTNLRRLGHLITRYDRRLLVHRSYEARLRTLYQEMVLDTVMPEVSAFKVALACRQPVQAYAPKSKAAASMRALAGELLTRIENRTNRKTMA